MTRKLLEDGKYQEAEQAARSLLAEAEAQHGAESLQVAEVLDLLVEGLWRLGKMKQPEPRTLAERAVTIKEKVFGPDHPEVATSLRNVGIILRDGGDYSGAKPVFERALAIYEKALGPDHSSVAKVLSDLAVLLMRTGDYNAARSFLERALALADKTLESDHPHLDTILLNLGIVLYRTGDYPGAKQYFQRALSIQEKTLSPDHPRLATTLQYLAGLYDAMGEYDVAHSLFERALAIGEKALGPDHPDVARILGTFGNHFIYVGDYTAARSLYERALAIQEKARGPQDPSVASCLNNIGNVLSMTGDDASARRFYERALSIYEARLGPEHPDVARALGNLAATLGVMGDYTEARKLNERALTILEKALGPDHPDVARALNCLGTRVHDVGDYAAAMAYDARALKIQEKALGPDHPDVAMSLQRLGHNLFDVGDYAAARPYFERALKIREKALGPDHPDVANTLYGLGNLMFDVGDYAAARPYFERALKIREKALGFEHADVALTLDALARVHGRAGEYASARRLHERVLAINEKNLGPNHPMIAWTLRSLAETLARAGEWKEALDLALRAEKISRDHLVLTASASAEREALTYASTRPSGLNLAFSMISEGFAETPTERRTLLDALIRSRALVLDEMAARHRAIANSEDLEVGRLAGELARAREKLARLVVRGPGNDPSERYRSLLDLAREEKEKAERALAEKSPTFQEELLRKGVGLEEVAAMLPSDSALVAFVRYKQYQLNKEQPPAKPPEAAHRYLAFVLRSGEKEPMLISLGDGNEIDRIVSRLSRQVAQEAMAGRASKSSEAAYGRVATELRQRVWDPVATQLDGAQRIFVVPDGALNLVNLAALPTGKNHYLIETGPQIHYLSAERDLFRLETQQAVGNGILAVGSPTFDEAGLFAAVRPQKQGASDQTSNVQLAAVTTFRGERSSCGAFQSVHFEPLPASAREAEEIISLWNQARGLGAIEGGRVRGVSLQAAAGAVHLKGAGATEAAFKQQASGRQVLHIATHGFFVGGRCPSVLGPPDRPHASELGSAVAGENPLLLAGLAFAGANHRQAAGPDEDDGILTAEEIAALDLRGVEWAVLSACDTGVGEVKAGEGVFGLRRAFQVAGVRTLILSLWSVEDESARQWMRALYRSRFVEGKETAEAVRAASLEVLRQRKAKKLSTHPFYWAGFVAAGDWR